MEYQAAQNALDKSKILLISNPDALFFASVCFFLKTTWTTDIPTAQTDGKEIRFNPEFFLSLSTEERVFLLLHETLHVAFMHTVRLEGRDRRRWNAAGDYVINSLLVKRNFKMPKGGLYDPQFDGLSTEQVYDLLEEPPQDFEMDIQECADDDIQSDIDDILVRAKVQVEAQNTDMSTIPKDIQTYLEKLLNPQLPWHRILRNLFTEAQRSDYNWKKPNRRYFPKHLLPAISSEQLANIVVAVDTSGSVRQEQFDHFLSETHSILKSLRPKQITLLHFDTRIKSIEKLRSLRDLAAVEFYGRGGTQINEVIDWAKENKPNALIIFTDGQFQAYSVTPDVPVFWVIYGTEPFSAEYGKIIKYDFEDVT